MQWPAVAPVVAVEVARILAHPTPTAGRVDGLDLIRGQLTQRTLLRPDGTASPFLLGLSARVAVAALRHRLAAATVELEVFQAVAVVAAGPP